jgi:hypothetical protein
MASPYDLYDPALLGAAPSTAPGGITGLLQDRNFLQLLAGIGSNLDPKGVGGAIGTPTATLIASQAAQERAAKQAAAQNAQTKLVIDALNRHGGMSDAETPGVTSFKSTPSGLQMEITPQPGGVGNYSGSGLAEPPAAPSATIPQVPVAVPTPTPSASELGPTQPYNRRRGGTSNAVNTLLPFYSALLG